MPYKDIQELPENIQNVLPKNAQKIWMRAFNSSINEYDEETAFKIAWYAVKVKYKKTDKGWVKKKSL